MNLVHLPAVDQLCLGDDANLTPTALREGTIVQELSIAWMEEVKAIKREHVVIDVGAFIGDTALIFAEHSDHVIAFEPQTDAYVCARYNTIGKATVHNAAVGNGENVYCKPDTLEGNLGTRGMGIGGEAKSVRIDDLGIDRLDFLKIDCEGFEPNVIRGAMETLRKFHPVILVEVYKTMLQRYGFTKEDIVLPLLGIGYIYRCAIGREEDDRCDLLFQVLT